MTPKELEALRETLDQRKKRKEKASSFTLKRVKLIDPESVEAPPKLTPVVAKVAFETTVAPPPLTIMIPQLFPSNILT